MTTIQTSGDSERPLVPEWDLADRMSKALRTSGVGVSEIADMLGVTRDTISRWINGRGEPKRAALLAWAAITNVSLHWLEYECSEPHASSEAQRECELRARRDSNPKPSDLYLIRSVGPLADVKPMLTPDRRAGIRPARHLRSVS